MDPDSPLSVFPAEILFKHIGEHLDVFDIIAMVLVSKYFKTCIEDLFTTNTEDIEDMETKCFSYFQGLSSIIKHIAILTVDHGIEFITCLDGNL